jgi:hypothetical protein
MTPEEIKIAEQNSENEGGTPEGVEASENDVIETTDDVIETPEVEPTDEVVEEVQEEAPVAEETVADEPVNEVEELKNALAKANAEIEELKNTVVVNTKLSKSIEEEKKLSPSEIEKNFLSKTWAK